MNERPSEEFFNIFGRATIFTLGICLLFAWSGDFLLRDVFQVSLPAVQVFGGLIISTVAFTFILRGPEGIKLFRGDVTEIAQQITLPLLVGPGVIWISITIGQTHSILIAIAIISSVLFINILLVFAYQRLLKGAKGRIKMMILKYFAMAMRLNALMIGAVSIDMILTGIHKFINQNHYCLVKG